MNPIVEKVYQIGIIPVIAFNSVDEALPLCKALADGGLPAAEMLLCGSPFLLAKVKKLCRDTGAAA